MSEFSISLCGHIIAKWLSYFVSVTSGLFFIMYSKKQVICVKGFNCEMGRIIFILNDVIFLLKPLKDTASLSYCSGLI